MSEPSISTEYAFSVFAGPPLAAAALMLFLGVLAVVRERGSRMTVPFLSITVSVAVWLICFSIMYSSRVPEVALFWARAGYLGIAFIPVAVYHFTTALVSLETRERLPAHVPWLWAGSAVLSVLIQTTGMVPRVVNYRWGFYPQYAWQSLPFLAFFYVVLLAAMVRAVKGYRRARSDRERKRMGWFTFSFAIGYIALVDYLPSFGLNVYPFGFVAIAAFVAAAGYTLYRFHFAEVTPRLAAERMLETTRGNVLVTDTNRIIRLANEQACATLGYSERELAGQSLTVVFDSLPPEPDGRASPFVFRNREFVWKSSTGELIDMSVSAAVISDRRGRPAGFVYDGEDISHDKKEEALRRALVKSEKRYRILFERNLAGICRLTTSGEVRDCNPSLAHFLGYENAEALIAIKRQLLPINVSWDALLERLMEAGFLANVEICLVRSDGLIRWALANLSFISDEETKESSIEAICVDLTQRKRSEEEAEFGAFHDPLTGLANRSLFNDRLTLAMANQMAGDKGLALFYIDLDGFKPINDEFGHETGDQVLKDVAERLLQSVRGSDTVARLGGDEFAIIVCEISGAETLSNIANQLLHSLHQPFRHQSADLRVSASIGIAACPRQGITLEQLIGKADEAMYLAKTAGKNTFRFADDDNPGRSSDVVSDVSAVTRVRKMREAQTVFQAYHDDLTGLPNRALLLDRVNIAIANARRERARQQPVFCALMCVDLDRFGLVNDAFGHSAGDRVLQAVGRRFREALREGDTVARFGGDQFIIFLSRLVDPLHAGVVAKKLLATLELPIPPLEQNLLVTAHIGVAIFPQDGDSLDELVLNGESALYQAKQENRESFRFCTPASGGDALPASAVESVLRRVL